MRILVVEDERKVASFICQGLEEEGHAVETAADGAEALDLVLAGPPYDLVVLDLMLPKRDGFGVLKSLRDRGVSTPVLVLTARDSVAGGASCSRRASTRSSSTSCTTSGVC